MLKLLYALILIFAAVLFCNPTRADGLKTNSIPPVVSKSPLDSFVGEPINPVLLEGYNKKIRDSSTNYKRRFQRSQILLKHGESGPPTAEDIDTLLRHPDWKDEGKRLQAIRLYLLGRMDEAKALIRQNIRDNVHEHEQARFLAALELSEKDTAAALEAYRMTWELYHDENVYVDWLELCRSQKKVPEELLREGLKLYPHSPGPTQSIFETYFAGGDPPDLRKSERVADRAENALWPRSVDWKLRHAKSLLALGQSKKAEGVLLRALDLMEEDPRLQTNSDDVPRLRQEIFTLLEAARK